MDKINRTLLRAAERGTYKTVENCLKKGGNVNCKDDNQKTPLHLALEEGHTNIAEHLILKEADINLQDYYKLTPLHKAAQGGHTELVDLLISRGADINIQDGNKNTALHLALESGHTNTAKILILKGADINIQNNYEQTPLYIAANRGHTELADLLISRGADINIQCKQSLFSDDKKETPLHKAAQGGYTELVDLLISRGADINIQDGDQKTPLHLALEKGHINIAEHLILKEADINLQDSTEQTPLHIAANRGHTELADLLISRGADINIQCKQSWFSYEKQTPLHKAAQGGYTELVDLLISRGADINIQVGDETPLHKAAQGGYTELVDLLISRGADINIQDFVQKTPLHLALEKGHINIAEHLILKEADINLQDCTKNTALHLALTRGHTNTAKLLILKGADINIQNNYEQTPLQRAANRGHTELADLLISRGADINIRDGDKNTALHLAVEGGHTNTAKLLILKGADINIQNNYEQTPLYMAAKEGHTELADLLISRGADINTQGKQSRFSDDRKNTALHLALKSGHTNTAKLLILKGADINIQNNYKQTPLHEATQGGYKEMVELLVSRGADVNVQDNYNESPFYKALSQKRKDIVDLMVCHGADKRKSYGWDLLHAAQSGDIKTVESCLEKEADINLKDQYGQTPLHLSIVNNKVDIAETLISRMADINVTDCHNKTPLHLAAEGGNTHMTNILLFRGADIAIKTDKSRNSLHLAAMEGHTNIADQLISRGANINVTDRQTPLHLALQNGHIDIASMLVKRGANVSTKGSGGLTPLHLAARTGQTDIAVLLLSYGADIKARSYTKKTATEVAIGEVRTFLKLIEKGFGTDKALEAVKHCKDLEEAENYIMAHQNKADSASSCEQESNIVRKAGFQKAGEETDLLGIFDAKEYRKLLAKGSYESFWNRIYLIGASNVGKTTLASLLIGEDISQYWTSTNDLKIYFGSNGIDLKEKNMIPLKKDVVMDGASAGDLAITSISVGDGESQAQRKTKIEENLEKTHKLPKLKFTLDHTGTKQEVIAGESKSTQASSDLLGFKSSHDLTYFAQSHRKRKNERKLEQTGKLPRLEYTSVHKNIKQEFITTEYTTKTAPSDLADLSGHRSYDMKQYALHNTKKKHEEKEGCTHSFPRLISASVSKDIKQKLKTGAYKVTIAPSDLVIFSSKRAFDATHQLCIKIKGAFTLLFDGRKGLQDPLEEYPEGDVTSESILKNWVDSILVYSGDDDNDVLPVILFVATHGDWLTEAEQLQKRKEFQEGLANLFRNHEQHHRIRHNDIFFINGLDVNDPEVERLKANYVHIAFQQKTWGNKIPLAWVPLDLQMSEMRTNNISIISKDELININRGNEDLALTAQQLDMFLRAQNALGKILYFEGHGLQEYVIVNPTTLVHILGSFIKDEIFWPEDTNLRKILKDLKNTGKIRKTDLFRLWSQDEFNPLMSDEDFKEFVLQVLIHLDLLVEPKRCLHSGTLDFFLVPCIVNQLPTADFTEHLKEENAICLSYKHIKSSIPMALAFKIIGAVLNVWPLKETKQGICLFHKAAILCIDTLNELYVWILDDRVKVYMLNATSKHLISNYIASRVQKFFTFIVKSSLEFYHSSFGNFVSKAAISNSFVIEVGEMCDRETCYIPLSEAQNVMSWKCLNGKEHSTKYALYWTHDKTKQVVQDVQKVQKAPEETTYKEPVCITFPSMEEDDEKQIKSLQMSISSSTKCDPFDTEFIVPANIAKEVHFYSTNILTDFGNISRLYDGYFVECIEHNQSRNKVGPNKGPSDMASVSNRYIVDCIIDKRLDAKRMEIGKPISFEQLLNTKDKPEFTVLASIKTHIRSGAIISATLSQKIILGAINRPHSMLCRLMISLHKQLNTSIHVYLHALELAMEQSEMDYAKAIAWFITRIFVKRHIHSYQNIRDIWPAFVCNCKENSDTIFCSKKICIVIELTSIDSDLSLPVIFKSVDIKLLQHKDDGESEAKFINTKIKHIKHIFITKEMSVTGVVAEKLFKKHSKLTIITNSLCKSKGFHDKQNQEVVDGPCIQLYCRGKGLIPVGEEHFPQNVCGLQTDIVEGQSSFMGNIRIGDLVGRSGKVGTLGGFVQVRGDLAFLTCCHVIADESSLAPVNISFDDSKPVLIEYFPWCKMQDGTYDRKHPYVCGRIREAPAFETDNSDKVSLDAVLVTLKKKVITIEQNNFIANGDDLQFSMDYLGLKTEYLNENCLDYNQFCYGIPRPHVQVISIGAISGIFYTNPEMSKDKEEGTSIDLQSFQDSYIAVDKEYNQTFTSWIKEILKTDSENDMPIDVGRFIEEKCGMGTSSETKAHLTDVIRRVVDRLKVDSNLAINIENLLHDEIRNTSTNNATIFGGTHIQTLFLAKTADRRDIRRLSRRMYNQIYITEVPFKPGDSGTCIYVKEPEICGCVGMAIADHSGGGCIATPIMEILKHFKIRIIDS